MQTTQVGWSHVDVQHYVVPPHRRTISLDTYMVHSHAAVFKAPFKKTKPHCWQVPNSYNTGTARAHMAPDGFQGLHSHPPTEHAGGTTVSCFGHTLSFVHKAKFLQVAVKFWGASVWHYFLPVTCSGLSLALHLVHCWSTQLRVHMQ